MTATLHQKPIQNQVRERRQSWRIIEAIDCPGLLERLEHPNGKVAQARDVFRIEAGPDAATTLVEVPIEQVMHGFDLPMAIGRGCVRQSVTANGRCAAPSRHSVGERQLLDF
jgi:hypothetical protein